MHRFENLVHFSHLLDLYNGLENSPSCEVKHVKRILAVADCCAGDGKLIRYEETRVGSGDRGSCVLRNTDTHEMPIEAQELETLSVGQVGSRADNHGVGAKAIAQSLYPFANGIAIIILGELGDVHKVVRTGGENQVLLAWVVDANDL